MRAGGVGVARNKEFDVRKVVSLPAALAEAIDDYRFDERIKTEAEAVRRLIEAGLAAKGRKVQDAKGSDDA